MFKNNVICILKGLTAFVLLLNSFDIFSGKEQVKLPQNWHQIFICCARYKTEINDSPNFCSNQENDFSLMQLLLLW